VADSPRRQPIKHLWQVEACRTSPQPGQIKDIWQKGRMPCFNPGTSLEPWSTAWSLGRSRPLIMSVNPALRPELYPPQAVEKVRLSQADVR